MRLVRQSVWMVLLIVMGMLCAPLEAGHKHRCRSKCRAVSQVRTVAQPGCCGTAVKSTTKSKVVEEHDATWKCGPAGCRLQASTEVHSRSVVRSTSTTVSDHQGGLSWAEEAQSQADEMARRGISGHVRSAAETARRVTGSASQPIFVGVGINGQTCSSAGRLVADATAVANGRSYHCRIWLK